ncbi:MAG: DUF262 domain-containing HNH endonuclease family protein [Minwuia sp.]|nr:DUF262 domain-containing HNH endonuclease family protein [Minwuia sp.]
MANNIFNTANETYRQLLSGGSIFRIPRFQRDYSWKEEHWEDLWSDIQDLINDPGTEAHYMGYLVLQPTPDRSFDIIDGQQRITTLSLFILAGMRKIKELAQGGIEQENNETRLNEIRRTYIGQLDTISLSVNTKLSLNRNNDHYYQTYLTTLREMPARGFKSSEHSMRKATEWFLKKISDYIEFGKSESSDQGRVVAELIDKVSQGLFFTVITVDDELNAYKVFETLNARGVKLSAPDLLKNYLFSIINRDTSESTHDFELDKVEGRWSDILDRLQSDNITSYLRTYWGSNYSFVRQSELFKIIKRKISNREDAYKLISGLEDGLETYLSLTQPDQSNWTGEDKDNAKLLKMFSVRQPLALLMATREKIPTGFSVVLRGIVNITFRYNVISNLQAAEQERTYSRVAIGISSGIFTNANEILKELSQIYPNDEIFRANFATKVFDTGSSRNKQIVRYILAKLDAQSSGTPFSPPSPEITIEHVLPENPGDDWAEVSDADVESSVYRIGNMILLEDKLNSLAGNSSFESKKNQYRKSSISDALKLSEFDELWNVTEIDKRQKKLAKLATTVWRVSQLH